MAPGPLGRLVPTDWQHVDKYPLRGLMPMEQPKGVPVVLGISWYSNFDNPVRSNTGRYWIGLGGLGSIRGGHAIMVKSVQPDAESWHAWYDQNPYGGACAGFAGSRMMSHYNRVRYRGEWLYWEAQKVDYWPGGDYPGSGHEYQGTAVSSVCDVLRVQGHIAPAWSSPRASAGISANRWLTTVDEVHQTIRLPLADKLGAVPLVNSWGTFFPRVVWPPDAVLAKLLAEDGECVVASDR